MFITVYNKLHAMLGAIFKFEKVPSPSTKDAFVKCQGNSPVTATKNLKKKMS